MTIHLYDGDLPDGLDLGPIVAIDSETMGLNPVRDRLCLVQMSSGDGVCHAVQFRRGVYHAPNLVRMLGDPKVEKLFHFARFDLAVCLKFLGVMPEPIWCTKVASKLARTFTDRHGLKDLVRDLLGLDLNKQMQSSDWGAEDLTPEQLKYAAGDVLYLHGIKAALETMLVREGRLDLAQATFAYLPTRARLDLAGYGEVDLLAH